MTAYDKLMELQLELKLWDTIQSISFWDQLTVMPKNSGEFRGEQNAILAKTRHKLITSSEYEDAVLKASEDAQNLPENNDSKIQVKRLKETFERSKKLSSDLVSRLAKASVAGSTAWEKSKLESNTAIFLNELENLVVLAKEKAEAYGYEKCPYDALIEDFEPEMTSEDFDTLYNPMKDELSQLVQEAKDAKGFKEVSGVFPSPKQEKLSRELAQELGFSFDNGAIMTSSHPFSITMGSNDFRITTRYLEDEPFSGFYSTAHEVGHSLYERGLVKPLFGTPLGEAATAGVHESQSLFWENRVCRSPEFLENWHSNITSAFEPFQSWSKSELCRTVNRVKPDFKRVEADESTYSLHIIIRYEIEKLLFAGQLEAHEVETAWNESYKKYLGLTVEDPKLGCLQDVHWSEGLFGYFPSYALGHILSAQFSETMDKDLGGLDKRIAEKDYASILSWLDKSVHSKGRKHHAKDLIKEISGENLSSSAFIKYLKKKQERVNMI